MRLVIKTFLLVFLLSQFKVFSQKRYNPTSVEVSIGTPVPLFNAIDSGSRAAFVGLNSFNLSVRNMVNETFGYRGTLNISDYMNSALSNPLPTADQYPNSFSANRISLEGVMQLTNLFPVNYRLKEHIGLLITTGLGASFANSNNVLYSDTFYSLMAGGTLQVKLSKRWSAFGIVNGFAHFDQNINYAGAINEEGFWSIGTEILGGLQYNIGSSRKRHADWY